MTRPDRRGHFGPYGGMYVPETLMAPLEELARQYAGFRKDPVFRDELKYYLRHYVGRPTPLYHAERMSEKLGTARIYLKREDLCHTGAHKINNSLAQVLMARRMGKKRVIAETGAGQHGVATATVAAMFGLECVIYMGKVDMDRQALNVFRMESLGAQVVSVTAGQQTLKEAISEAMRDWVTHVRDTHYVLGSALGAHPYPVMVRDFQSVIGREARSQCLRMTGRLPSHLVACVGGGSNAIGLFYPFLKDKGVRMTGVEAGGLGIRSGQHASRFSSGRVGVLQGTRTYVLQNGHGQIASTHSISAGLDYAAVGPEHSLLRDMKRVDYTHVTDRDAVRAFDLMGKWEGILPALEPSHAVAYAVKKAKQWSSKDVVIINMSGRGDKDVQEVADWKKSNSSQGKSNK